MGRTALPDMTGHNVPAHASATLHIWRRLRDLKAKSSPIILDGNSLDIAAIVAVARHDVKPTISTDPRLAHQLDLSSMRWPRTSPTNGSCMASTRALAAARTRGPTI